LPAPSLTILHLQALPFDEIKVDRSFVASMVESPQSRKIVAAVVALGQSLGLRTIAEGIEHAEQRDILSTQGCNIGQGWLFGKAVNATELSALLAQPLFEPATASATPANSSHRTAPYSADPRLKIPVKPLKPMRIANRPIFAEDFARKNLA
jgi:predicted signal transduction protein with EAL and GGDEF domain